MLQYGNRARKLDELRQIGRSRSKLMKSMVFRGVAALLLATLSLSGMASNDRLERQRAAFREAWEAAQYGRWTLAGDDLRLLENYVLYPDLRAAWLRARIDAVSAADVERFLAEHPELPASRELRRRWLAAVEARGDWPRYLALYEDHFSASADARLRCVALDVQRKAGVATGFVAAALDLWMVGVSQPDVCDPVFAELERLGELTHARVQKRLRLALDARQISLARYLARRLGEGDRNLVDRWVRMRDEPGEALAESALLTDTAGNRELIRYGVERLIRRNPLEAAAVWPILAERFSFERETRWETSREIALTAAYRHLPEALDLLENLSDAATSSAVLEWRMRLGALTGHWDAVLDAHAALSADAAESEVWRYWKARALEALGQPEVAAATYAALAGERSYYGFLAADRRNAPYAYSHRPVAADETVITELALRPALIRARELFFVGLDGRGRAEWNEEMKLLDPRQREQAALLAHRWGWHSRAIATAAQAGVYDDLALRYPTPFRDTFDGLAPKARVAPTWAYGITRSESLFMPDVGSSAGALGLMQLLPSTGRETARRAQVDYRGSASLLDPRINIALGTWYLGDMHDRFDGNKVLATAAYNAGSSRVLAWLPEDEAVPADVWIEAIPFKETRAYVQRVLAAEAIFYWRMKGETQRLSASMPAVRPLHALGSRVAGEPGLPSS
ncbi:lytic transglycosylase Slt [soil metagenome]